ncbi:hypothetical protein [Melghirimyces algeriensis]|uniref:hypothetical protein n=1 Tax=Melghirimyces algeriensis TaxID=910412 RepID=UPI00115B63A9|nr:hypothetical protein [Melghirimyces algeriensis]
MERPFPTTQRNLRRYQPFSGHLLFPLVRWLRSEGMERTIPLLCWRKEVRRRKSPLPQFVMNSPDEKHRVILDRII